MHPWNSELCNLWSQQVPGWVRLLHSLFSLFSISSPLLLWRRGSIVARRQEMKQTIPKFPQALWSTVSANSCPPWLSLGFSLAEKQILNFRIMYKNLEEQDRNGGWGVRGWKPHPWSVSRIVWPEFGNWGCFIYNCKFPQHKISPSIL